MSRCSYAGFRYVREYYVKVQWSYTRMCLCYGVLMPSYLKVQVSYGAPVNAMAAVGWEPVKWDHY